MGSAACYHLAGRGLRVLGLDQFEVPHTRGSHHGHSRMIRQSYFEHPDYVPLLRRAYQLWDELDEAAGSGDAPETRIFHRTGGLYLGPADGSIVPGALAAARAHGLSHELLEAAQVKERFPQFRVPEGTSGFYEENAGFLVPELAIAAHVELARKRDAEIRSGEEILGWESTSTGVAVRTRTGTIEAGHLVLTAGAWSAQLLRDLKVSLTVTRQVLAWFDAQGEAESLMLGRFPCWFLETDPPYGHYGFPMMKSGQAGFKIALHKPGELVGEADAERAEASEEEIAALRQVLRSCLPGGDGPLLASRTCLYTNSADSHFVLGEHPTDDHVSFAAGFSGHGFKFASVMGEVLADLASEGSTEHPVDFLSWRRFA